MGKSLICRRAYAAFLLLACTVVQAQDVRTFLPVGAHAYAPVLAVVQSRVWPAAIDPFTLAGQVEQESCISLRHSKCWNPRAELKTSREYGFGLGQVTVAYNANGSERFNKFEELRRGVPSLRGWAWTDRYNVEFQLTAIVEMDKALYNSFDFAATVQDRWAFSLAAYNGGKGGLLQDRLMCSNVAGCDASRWFGHVEHTSVKSRQPYPGYGKSAFEINRDYPRVILQLRRDKYRVFWN